MSSDDGETLAMDEYQHPEKGRVGGGEEITGGIGKEKVGELTGGIGREKNEVNGQKCVHDHVPHGKKNHPEKKIREGSPRPAGTNWRGGGRERSVGGEGEREREERRRGGAAKDAGERRRTERERAHDASERASGGQARQAGERTSGLGYAVL
ncbi:hypothetical protein KSP39_PZI016619 [Platanthera zijinensis]|uniref:Uncharacterized protein n=1 Tax=Platanthera zijinensis TaxID=2320716 RepID=A0AAP0G0D7_9ASPA